MFNDRQKALEELEEELLREEELEEEMPEEAEMEEYLYSSGDVQKKPVLLSLNPKYDPIRVTQNNEFQIIGKVLNRNGLDFNG